MTKLTLILRPLTSRNWRDVTPQKTSKETMRNWLRLCFLVLCS